MPSSKRKNAFTTLTSVSAVSGGDDIFGPPTLLEGENRSTYELLWARVSAAIKPTDIIEEMWVRDIVDLAWQVQRLRRLKLELMSSTSSSGLQSLLEPMDLPNQNELIDGWIERKPEVIAAIEEVLKKRNLTLDAIHAHTLLINMETFERIEHLISKAEARRNAAERELMRRRFALIQMMPQPIKQIEAENNKADAAA